MLKMTNTPDCKNSTDSTQNVSKMETSDYPPPSGQPSMNPPVEQIAQPPVIDANNIGLTPFPEENSPCEGTPLTEEEKASLAKFEEIIQGGLKSFNEVGEALFQIQAKRLYRAEHTTFESYLKSVWNLKRAQAYRLISAHLVHESIQGQQDNNLNESQARVLAGLTDEQRPQALRIATELAGGKRRTAKHLKQAANQIQGKNSAEPRAKKSRQQSDDDQSAQLSTPRPPTPTPSAPSPAGTTVPDGATKTKKSIAQIIDALRVNREEIQKQNSIEAAIEFLFRLEGDLLELVTTVASGSITSQTPTALNQTAMVDVPDTSMAVHADEAVAA